MLRLEKEANARHLKQKKINIRTVADLLNISNLQLLAADLFDSLKEVHKRQSVDLHELSIEEMKKYSLLQNQEVLGVALKKHKLSVKRYQKELSGKSDTTFYSNIEYQIITKFNNLIA